MRLSMSSPRYPRWGKGWGRGEDLTTSTCPRGGGLHSSCNCTCTPGKKKHAVFGFIFTRQEQLEFGFMIVTRNTPLAQSPQHVWKRLSSRWFRWAVWRTLPLCRTRVGFYLRATPTEAFSTPKCTMSEEDTRIKTVLVCVGERRRPVQFSGSNQQLCTAVRKAFTDVITPTDGVFLQIKDETWGGMFIDLVDQDVPDRSVLKANITSSQPPTATHDQGVC